jgi:hypothetical protein
MPNVPKWLIIHCSVSSFGDVALIRQWHLARGWKNIGYHKVILNGKRAAHDLYSPALDGLIEQGRADDAVGAHCPGYNTRSLAICVINDPAGPPITQKQWESLGSACSRLCRRHGIPAEKILGHRETPSGKKQGKTCPGKWIVMDALRALVKADLARDGG